MKLNWNFISKIFARTVGVENLSRDAEGHEVLSADQRKILEQKFGPEALQHYDAYAASDANDDAQQEQLLLNFLDAIGRSGGDDKDKLRQELAKAEEKIKQLQEFVARFSANASKSKQATSRKKMLDKLTVEELPASSRRYPFVGFDMDREAGRDLLTVDGLSKTVNGEKLLNNISFTLNHDDKIAIIGENEIAITALMQILAGEDEPDEGTVKWGVSTSRSYFPKDNSKYFDGCELNLVDWLRQYSAAGFETQNESYIRGFLGRMLFSGDDVFKQVNVLSGGEKVRCMLSRMMLYGSNILILDQPTNHLDLESITAVNNGLKAFKGNVIFASHDHEFVNTVANRIIDIREDGTIVDRMCTFDEYIEMKRGN